MARVEPVDLALLHEKTAPYRCDQLFELSADLAETCELFEWGRVNDTVVREMAVAVAAEALKVWLSTCRPASDGRAS
jgi:hypothetical protein